MPITAGAIIGLGSGLYQTISGSKQQKKGQQAFEEAMSARPQYQISDTVKQQLAEAQSRYNAQNPAIAMAYQQAQQGMAGQMANAQRNASSGAQALAAGAGAQAQLQSIAPQLAAQQAAYSQQQQANLNQARGLMTEEQRTKFSDMLSANQARQNFGLGLAQSGSAMKSQGLGAIAQGGLSLATAGLNANAKTNAKIPTGFTNSNPFPTQTVSDGTISGALAPATTGVPIAAPAGMTSAFNAPTSPFQVGLNAGMPAPAIQQNTLPPWYGFGWNPGR
jgi:hypothetical protein